MPVAYQFVVLSVAAAVMVAVVRPMLSVASAAAAAVAVLARFRAQGHRRGGCESGFFAVGCDGRRCSWPSSMHVMARFRRRH